MPKVVHWNVVFWAALFVIAVSLSFALLWVTVTSPSPIYEYRLVGPDEAKVLVNDQGWHISQRMRPTDTLVYVYHRR